MRQGENTLPTSESEDIKRNFIKYLEEGDFEEIKKKVQKMPSIVIDPKIRSLHVNPLLFSMNRALTELDSGNYVNYRKFFGLAIYFAESEAIDLLDRDSAGNNIFSLLEVLSQKRLENTSYQFEVDKILSAMCKKIGLKLISTKEHSHTPDSPESFDINGHDADRKTLAHYLYLYINNVNVSILFATRDDINLGLLDGEGKTIFEGKILLGDPTVAGEAPKINASTNNLLTLIKRARKDYDLSDSLFRSHIAELSKFLIVNMSYGVSSRSDEKREEALADLISLYRNKENVIDHLAIENLFSIPELFAPLENFKHRDILKALIDHQDRDGNNLLHVAIKYKLTDLVNIFLKTGCSLVIKNNRGDTPLHLAAFSYNSEDFQSIFSKRTNLTDLLLEKNNFDETPQDIQLSVAENSNKTIDEIYNNLNLQNAKFLLRSYKAALDPKIIVQKIEPEKAKITDESSINKYFNLSVQTIKSLFYSISTYISNFLSTFKAKPVSNPTKSEPMTILERQDSRGNTILHAVLMEDAILATRLTSCQNDEQKARVIEERRKGLICVIKELIECGVDVTKQNKDGDTAMHLAAKTGHRDLLDAFSAAQQTTRNDQPKKEGEVSDVDIFSIKNMQGKIPEDIIVEVLGEKPEGIRGKSSEQSTAQNANLPEKPEYSPNETRSEEALKRQQ